MTLPRKRKFRTRHHVLPKERKGTGHPDNIVVLWNDKHELYRALFGNRTLIEAAHVLIRLDSYRHRNRRHTLLRSA